MVGSGPGVKDNRPRFVDSFDVVVRVNNYKNSREAGFRTDVFYSYFGNAIKKTPEALKNDGVKLCMAKCPNSKPIESVWHKMHDKENGTDFRWIYEKRCDWWFCDTYVPTTEEFLAQFVLLGGHVPTSGFSALLDVLSYNPASVYMTGFDFFTSGVHNVNERWRQGDLRDPIRHVPRKELHWLKQNIALLPITTDSRLAHLIK